MSTRWKLRFHAQIYNNSEHVLSEVGGDACHKNDRQRPFESLDDVSLK